MNLTVWHYRNTDGTVTAKCEAFRYWNHTAPSLAESKVLAESSLRKYIEKTLEFTHYEHRDFKTASVA